MTTMSKMLRAIRVVRDLTQEELAVKSGVSAATISRIETGRWNPSDEETTKLQNALGVNFREIQGDFEVFLRSIGA